MNRPNIQLMFLVSCSNLSERLTLRVINNFCSEIDLYCFPVADLFFPEYKTENQKIALL